MTRLALASLVLVLVGCRVTPTTTNVSQPRVEPIVVESESSDPPPQPVAFGYVTPGGDRETGLPQIIDKGGLAWVADAVAFEDLAPELAEAMTRVGLGPDDDAGASEAIDPSVITKAGFGPKKPTIWLVDDHGVCEARISTPYVATYFEVGPTVEVSWRLEGCDPSRAWGPIGLFTVAPPKRLLWLESEVTFIDPIEPSRFTGRAAPLLREYTNGLESAPDEYWLRELSIGDTGIAQVQLGSLWRPHPPPGEAYEECEEFAEVTNWTGQWLDSTFELYELALDDSPWVEGAELVGAFVVDQKARWLVFSDRMQALVITPGAEPQTIITGVHHDEVVAFSGWSPAASCEP